MLIKKSYSYSAISNNKKELISNLASNTPNTSNLGLEKEKDKAIKSYYFLKKLISKTILFI